MINKLASKQVDWLGVKNVIVKQIKIVIEVS